MGRSVRGLVCRDTPHFSEKLGSEGQLDGAGVAGVDRGEDDASEASAGLDVAWGLVVVVSGQSLIHTEEERFQSLSQDSPHADGIPTPPTTPAQTGH
jgi:hypothetical protein